MRSSDINIEKIDEVAKNPTKSSIIEFLEDCGRDKDFEYVLKVSTFVEIGNGIDEILEIIIADDSLPNYIRINSFYALSYRFYKNKEVTNLEKIHGKYRSVISGEPFYYYLRSILHRERKQAGDLRRAVREIDKAVSEFPKNPGILKAGANTYLTALDNDVVISEKREMTNKAEEYITRAIDIYPDYAEYYSDLGRVRAYQKKFDKAESALYRAIDMENKNNENYALRIADYQHQLARIQLEKIDHQYETEVKTVQNKLSELEQESEEILRQFQVVVIQTLSFFGGLIALIVTFVQVSLSLPLVQASQLIMIIMGSIIIAFGGLSVVLPSEISLKRIGVIYLTGITLIMSAVVSIWI